MRPTVAGVAAQRWERRDGRSSAVPALRLSDGGRREAQERDLQAMSPAGSEGSSAQAAHPESEAQAHVSTPAHEPPTKLGVRAARADALHRLLASPRGAGVRVLADVHALADLGNWQRIVLDVAIADLVAAGKLEEDARGLLRVQPRGDAR